MMKRREVQAMDRHYFTCFGSISVLEYRSKVGIDIVIEDFDRLDDVAPVLIHAGGALANYIREIEGTDAEECYIQSTWTYDSNLLLCGIEIPSSDPNIPAKIIVNPERPPSGGYWLPTDQPIIFGPTDYIEEPHPSPMSREEHRRYFDWLTHPFDAVESEPSQEQKGAVSNA